MSKPKNVRRRMDDAVNRNEKMARANTPDPSTSMRWRVSGATGWLSTLTDFAVYTQAVSRVAL